MHAQSVDDEDHDMNMFCNVLEQMDQWGFDDFDNADDCLGAGRLSGVRGVAAAVRARARAKFSCHVVLCFQNVRTIQCFICKVSLSCSAL